MTVLEKNLNLKTIYKKVFLKYQANAMLPSLYLPSSNGIFGGRRKRKKEKKVSNPICGWDAPIITHNQK